MTAPRWSPWLLALTLIPLLSGLAGCPRTDTVYCYPGEDVDGCEGTEWEGFQDEGLLPDGDGTCPVGTYQFCPPDLDCPAGSSTEVMEAACQHAYDHDWSDCTVRFLCGPAEDAAECCYLIEVEGLELD